MELTDLDIAQLEAYWDGTLPDSAREQVAARLRDDLVFRDEADRLRATVAALDQLGEQRLRERLRGLEAQLPPIPAEHPFEVRWWQRPAWRIAAAAVFLLLGWVGWQWVKTSPAPAYASYFEAYPNLYSTLGDNTPAEAFRPYNDKKYDQAVKPLQHLFETSGDSLVLFYRAVAQVGAGEAADAVSALTALQHSKAAPSEAVRWYLALGYAQMGNPAAALPLLQELAGYENEYRGDAKKLGKALGKDL